ncbi:Two-component transcriptional regulator, LuxR family [Elusimicrobium minutum Pei191]|uniref:Two-component transcriptional regulator, LuxR family n=1 Tax=Elusimicrobium minutum (strain Pei191) TaxID=445932 RepID=B2KBW2_ELUMP|nr:response regulator transcription factor [Elusimicrobium minutum]ACC97866.1 Two-component transcriptional regulator, LuxR family [Elusimicrobium minutum Pei191]
MIRILLADDHALVRDGIKSILERKGKNISVVAEMGNGKEMLDYAVKNKNIDVYVVDIAMPILNGIAAVQKLLKINPDAKVIVLSMYDDRASVEKAFKAGARGFVVKVSSADEIIEAIKEVSAGRFYLCSKVSKFVVQGFLGKASPSKKDPSGLTPKEKQILQLIAEGFSSKEIAKEFGLSLNTVHVHRNNIMRKLDIHKQAELVRYAIKEGIAHL